MADLLSKELILKAQARRYKNLEVTELGGTLRVSSLSAARLLDYRKLEARRGKGEEVELEMIAYALAHGCVDGTGRALFASETEAAAVLEVVGYEVALRIFHEVIDLTTGGKKPSASATAETLGGNSEASPSGS